MGHRNFTIFGVVQAVLFSYDLIAIIVFLVVEGESKKQRVRLVDGYFKRRCQNIALLFKMDSLPLNWRGHSTKTYREHHQTNNGCLAKAVGNRPHDR